MFSKWYYFNHKFDFSNFKRSYFTKFIFNFILRLYFYFDKIFIFFYKKTMYLFVKSNNIICFIKSI